MILFFKTQNEHVIATEINHQPNQQEIDELSWLYGDATLMAEGDVTSPDFFHVYKTDRDYFPDIHLYGKDGNELPWQDYFACDDSVPSPGIGSAETNLVYWFCILLMLVGWTIVKYCWQAGAPKAQKSEETA